MLGGGAADSRIIQPTPFMYGVQGPGGGGVNALPSSSMISNTGIMGGVGGMSHNMHNVNQQQHQQQQQRFRSDSQLQHDHHHHNPSLPIQHGIAPHGGSRSSHPQGYPPHLMNTPTSSFPPSPQFSSPHMHPSVGGSGGGISFPTGIMDPSKIHTPISPLTSSSHSSRFLFLTQAIATDMWMLTYPVMVPSLQ